MCKAIGHDGLAGVEKMNRVHISLLQLLFILITLLMHFVNFGKSKTHNIVLLSMSYVIDDLLCLQLFLFEMV